MEIALYWLGAALSLAFGTGGLFELVGLSWYGGGPGPFSSGLTVGLTLMIVTAGGHLLGADVAAGLDETER
jgi:hypothetical protein